MRSEHEITVFVGKGLTLRKSLWGKLWRGALVPGVISFLLLAPLTTGQSPTPAFWGEPPQVEVYILGPPGSKLVGGLTYNFIVQIKNVGGIGDPEGQDVKLSVSIQGAGELIGAESKEDKGGLHKEFCGNSGCLFSKTFPSPGLPGDNEEEYDAFKKGLSYSVLIQVEVYDIAGEEITISATGSSERKGGGATGSDSTSVTYEIVTLPTNLNNLRAKINDLLQIKKDIVEATIALFANYINNQLGSLKLSTREFIAKMLGAYDVGAVVSKITEFTLTAVEYNVLISGLDSIAGMLVDSLINLFLNFIKEWISYVAKQSTACSSDPSQLISTTACGLSGEGLLEQLRSLLDEEAQAWDQGDYSSLSDDLDGVLKQENRKWQSIAASFGTIREFVCMVVGDECPLAYSFERILYDTYFANCALNNSLKEIAKALRRPDPNVNPPLISPSSIYLGQSFELTVTVVNQGGLGDVNSTLTISFPDFDDPTDFDQIQVISQDFTHTGEYFIHKVKGETIWHKNGYQIPASYLLIEGGIQSGKWGVDVQHTIKLRVTPKETGTFNIYVRSTLVDPKTGERVNDPPSSPVFDQQGFPVNRYTVEVNAPQVQVTLYTQPSGLILKWDGLNNQTPVTINCTVGSSHQIGAPSPQSGGSGTRYIFDHWSDGGAQTHTITCLSSNATYKAYFKTQYSLTTSVNPPNSGTVTPAETTWHDSGSTVSVQATPSPGWQFGHWTGDCSGGASTTVTMNGPKSCTASFVQQDTTPPALVTNFAATSGDGRCTLSWTNPSDTDLSEVIVKRKTGSYPSNHNDGATTYHDTTPTPGSLVQHADTGLSNGTTYYYAVFSSDNSGNWNDNVGPGQNVATCTPQATNHSPNQPSNPNPPDGATGVDINTDLSWTASDPDDDPLTFDVYFGPCPSPPSVASDHPTTTYDPGTLNYNTSYCWKIVAKDNRGGVTEGPVWQFATGTQPNDPPDKPTNVSPANGATDISLTPTLQASAFSDPNGDSHQASQWQVFDDYPTCSNVVHDSGEDTSHLTSYPVPSGVLNYNTTYCWHVKYKDNRGAWSQWSDMTNFKTKSQPQGYPTEGKAWIRGGYDIARTHYYPYGSAQLINLTSFVEIWTSDMKVALTGDVNGDGQLELIAGDGTNLKVYSGDGTLLWSKAVNANLNLIADVNNDGKDDIILSRRTSDNNLEMLFYDGQGNLLKTISKPGGYDSGIGVLAVYDFNGDGGLDVLAHEGAGYSITPRGASLFDYATGQEEWYYAMGTSGGVACGDIDNDNSWEVIEGGCSVHNGGSGCGVNNQATCTNDHNIWTVVFNVEDGSELFTKDYFADGESEGNVSHAVVDLDQDGIRNILAFEGHSYWYPGTLQIHLIDKDGNILKTWNGPYVDSGDSHGAIWAIGDVNNDGYPEIVFQFRDRPELILLDHNLQQIHSVSMPGINSIVINDVDGDGTNDVLVCDTNEEKLKVLDDSLQERWSYALNGIRSIALSDLNGDNINEIILMAASIHVLSAQPAAGTEAVFRVTKEGDVYADRAYYGADFHSGTGADIAEYINVSEPVEPGDVVELDPDRPGYYRKSRKAYSTLVAGVISSTPGITMGQIRTLETTSLPIPQTVLSDLGLDSMILARHSPISVDTSLDSPLLLTFDISISQLLDYLPALMEAWSKPLIALMGVVPVKVTAENGPIKPGDLLTTSSTPGYAMRCIDLKKCEGAIIGKALEPLDEGTGVIKMLVMH